MEQFFQFIQQDRDICLNGSAKTGNGSAQFREDDQHCQRQYGNDKDQCQNHAERTQEFFPFFLPFFVAVLAAELADGDFNAVHGDAEDEGNGAAQNEGGKDTAQKRNGSNDCFQPPQTYEHRQGKDDEQAYFFYVLFI